MKDSQGSLVRVSVGFDRVPACLERLDLHDEVGLPARWICTRSTEQAGPTLHLQIHPGGGVGVLSASHE